jgi:hypothetical protein
MQVFITANSPGELSGWVSPVVRELKARNASVRVTLVITPCQYASGMEAEFAQKQPGIDGVTTVKSLLSNLYLHKKPSCAEPCRVLFLGGDTFYAALIAKKMRAPLFGYVSKVRRVKEFSMFFIPDERTREESIKRGARPHQLTVAGHLGLDSIQINSGREEILRRLTGSGRESTVVTFLPGSRPAYIEYMLPFLLHSANKLWEMRPEIYPVVALSPFADRAHILEFLQKEGFKTETGDGFCDIPAKSGCRVRIVYQNQHEAISVSSLAITIPGTNNLQIAGMHVPMLVVVPLNKAEYIPLDGLAEFIFPKVYPLGLIKRNLFLAMNRKVKCVSLPNMIAGREIVPEMRGILRPAGVATAAADLLANSGRREHIAHELAEITRQRGAAGIIAEALLAD